MTSKSISKRDRALAELVRVRGWADDASIEKAIADASSTDGEPALGAVLLSSGLITAEQLRALEDAIDGRSSRPHSGHRSSSAGSAVDKTVARSDHGATVVPGPKKAPEAIGPYRLLRELGRGGMGVVYRALDPELRREVALKLMIAGAQASDADVERFRREAAVVARMGRHPNLIQIHDIGRDGERLYFTMDFIEGRSAKQRVDEDGAFAPREAAQVAADIAGVLAFAHKAGVVHRDVKPHNVLVDRDGKAFLGDFGLAKDLTSNLGLTETGSAFGTPAYMSPEQAAGQASQATHLSDVYSLGATLYEMLTGKPPFEGESGMEIVRRVIDTEPKPPRVVREGIHRDLEVICLKALHKTPARRYASAADLEADLRRFLNGEPILARPASALEKLRIRARRHKAVLSVTAAGLLAAAGIAGWAAWKVRERERQDAASRKERDRRVQEATPRILQGQELIDRSDKAHAIGGWNDRDAYAALAVEALLQARDILGDDADVHFHLGRALRRAKRADEALRALEKAVELNPRHLLAWFEHGMICMEALRALRGELARGMPATVGTDLGFAPTGLTGGMVMWESEARGLRASMLRDAAARDFQKVLESGAADERAAYGRAMLSFLSDRHEEALRDIDAALAANRYYVEARLARAEILEAWTRDGARGLDDRRELLATQPNNPEYAVGCAISLAVAGRPEEAQKVIAEALKKSVADERLLLRAASASVMCGDAAGAERIAEKVIASTKDRGALVEATRVAIAAKVVRRDWEGARERAAEAKALIGADAEAAYRAEILFFQGRVVESCRAFRELTPGSYPWRVEAACAAYLEWLCGNQDRALEMAEAGVRAAVMPAERMIRGLARMEAGDYAGAREDFEAVKAGWPGLNVNHNNLAAVKFLTKDYAGAMESLEDAMVATSPNDKQKQAIRNFFKPQRKRASEVKTPREAAQHVEGLAGLLAIAAAGMGTDAGAAAVKEGQRGLFYVLNRFYEDEGLNDQAIGAARRYLAISKHGNMTFRLARALAKTGKNDEAVSTLIEAMELGFDSGRRIDEEKAFDRIRERLAEARARCR